MHKISIILAIFVLTIITFAIPSNASNLTEINQLIENAKNLDNKQVSIQGELIGEALERGEYAWLNINDKTNAIGVWIKQTDIKAIKFYGDYKYIGDIVEIKGTFHKACPEHGGDVDIHVAVIKIVKEGYAVKDNVSYKKVITTLGLVIITLLLFLIYLRIMKRHLKS